MIPFSVLFFLMQLHDSLSHVLKALSIDHGLILNELGQLGKPIELNVHRVVLFLVDIKILGPIFVLFYHSNHFAVNTIVVLAVSGRY